MGIYFVIFSFQWDDITVYVKEEKDNSFGKFFNIGRMSFYGVFPIIIAIISLFEPQPGCVWWKEPRQSTQWDIIKGLVWHTSSKIRDRKYLEAYRMSRLCIFYVFGLRA